MPVTTKAAAAKPIHLLTQDDLPHPVERAPVPAVLKQAIRKPIHLLTQDDLPYDDGMPLESPQHDINPILLRDLLATEWADQRDYAIGGNQFLYFRGAESTRRPLFLGPDFYVTLGVPRGVRKSWLVWQEGKAPDLIVEFLSEATAKNDRGAKKDEYRKLGVTEYYYCDPFADEFHGFRLREGSYFEIPPDAGGGIWSNILGFRFVKQLSTYVEIEHDWLRLARADGTLLPTQAELADQNLRAAEQQALADLRLAEQHLQAVEQQASADRARAALMAERLRAAGLEVPD